MLRRARIEKIIDNDTHNKYFTALITWLDMDGGFYNEASTTAQISLSYSYISRSFGIQYYPVTGDIVLCGFLPDENPIIISFLATMYYSKVSNSNDFGYFFRNIVQGEYVIKGLRGNEIYIDRVGSLRFITRDQSIEQTNLKKLMDENKDIDTKNYITELSTGVDLTKQILDFTKTEVTIGKVYDDKYKEEQLLNDQSIAIQIVGKTNTPKYDKDGNLESVEIEETFKIQINTEGEISLGRADDAYSITIDKDGNMNILGTQIKIEAKQVIMENKTLIPDGKGSFCALPQCLFTGATHIGSMAQSEEE